MAQPEADRRPLRLRAMPPGRLWRKRRNPHHAGCHNNRAGRGRSAAAARSCFRAWAESHSGARRCRNCSGSSGSRPCPTGSGPRSATGRPKRRIIPERWWRRRWRTRSATRSKRLIGARTCSSAGAGSWPTGRTTWPVKVENRRPDRPVDPPRPQRRSVAFPRGIDEAGATPQRGGAGCENPPRPMPVPSTQNRGSLPSASEISERASPVWLVRRRTKKIRKIGGHSLVNSQRDFL